MKKIHLIYLSIIAVFFTSTLVLIYLNYLKPQSPSSPPTTGTIPTETPDLTADWKTYENKGYRYQFSCPQGSTHSIEVTNGNGFTIPLYQERCTEGKDSFKIMVYNINAKLTLDEDLNSTEDTLSSTIKTSTDEKLQVKLEGFDEKYYNQILSTFKFIEPTSNWKIYQDDNLGIEIKYPNGWEVAPGPEDNSFQVKLIVPEEMFYHQIVFSKTNAKNFDGVLKELFEQDDVLASINPNVKPEKVILNSYIASKAVINTALGLPSVNILVTDPNGDNILIEYLQTQESSDIFTIHQKILSTFKFTQ